MISSSVLRNASILWLPESVRIIFSRKVKYKLKIQHELKVLPSYNAHTVSNEVVGKRLSIV